MISLSAIAPRDRMHLSNASQNQRLRRAVESKAGPAASFTTMSELTERALASRIAVVPRMARAGRRPIPCSGSAVLRRFAAPIRPPAFGCWGEFDGNGIWRSSNEFIRPESLYETQLAERQQGKPSYKITLLRRSAEDSTNPEPVRAADLVKASHQPAPSLKTFILASQSREPIPCEPGDTRRQEPTHSDARHLLKKAVSITNGWLVCDGKLVVGAIQDIAWWRGNIRPAETASAEPCLTRFVPGRSGRGLTDDLDALAGTMLSGGKVALDHHYGLWYERRRDDHERVRRATGDAWPPFYELPFARSGQGIAWDGMSKYDLTKYNPWYWGRLKQFAKTCDERGLVLFHQNYFQHNILEAGAHWADFPWRSANNINETGFPEPPPYAGDKRIFMAEQFYDVANPVRRKLHRAYIRQCLDNFAANSNVIQFTSAEFTGPLHFVQFWIDVIAQWEKETGKKPLIALSCTKDVQDIILNDPERSKLANLVDFRYWWKTDKGTFEAKGGQNLAPRQFERQWKGGHPMDKDLAEMATEYRTRFPSKAVISNFPQAGWAFLCAGGSIPNLRNLDKSLLTKIPLMQPWLEGSHEGHWALRREREEFLIYMDAASRPSLDLSHENGGFVFRQIDLKTLAVGPANPITAGKELVLPKSAEEPAVFWITR